MALVVGAELREIIVESGESAKGLNRPGMPSSSRCSRGQSKALSSARGSARMGDPAKAIKAFQDFGATRNSGCDRSKGSGGFG
jgi:hypothetical protein